MIIDQTYPIFSVRWLVVHGLAVATIEIAFLAIFSTTPPIS